MGISFYFITVVLSILLVISAVNVTPDESRMKILNECKTIEKATDDDVTQFAAHKLPKGPNAKCFMACFYEKLIVIRENKVQPHELKSMLIQDANNNEKILKNINSVVNECKSIFDRDRCEFASKLRSCLDKAAIIQGLNQM